MPYAREALGFHLRRAFLSRPIWGHSFYMQSGHLATRLRLRLSFHYTLAPERAGFRLLPEIFQISDKLIFNTLKGLERALRIFSIVCRLAN